MLESKSKEPKEVRRDGSTWRSGSRCFRRRGSCAKALGQAHAWHVAGTARRPLWLQQKELDVERGGQGPDRAGLAGSWGPGEDWACPLGCGSGQCCRQVSTGGSRMWLRH